MNSVTGNEDDRENYNWSTADEEWLAPWGGTRSLWITTIFPRIGQFLPADRIVEIGCGFGRIAKVLHAFAESELVLLDTTKDCVDKCAQTFAESSKTRCLKTDGRSLRGVADNSVDLVFSIYSLANASADTIRFYLQECGRVLRDDGAAFLHHSNFGMYIEGEYPQADEPLRMLADTRDSSVDAASVRDMATDNDLLCIKQECINWDVKEVLSDCFSTIVRPDSKWAQEPRLVHNPDFQNERNLAAKRAHEKRIRTDQSWGLL